MIPLLYTLIWGLLIILARHNAAKRHKLISLPASGSRSSHLISVGRGAETGSCSGAPVPSQGGREHFTKTESNGLAVPGCSEIQTTPKGLGWPRNKPLMRNVRGPAEALPDRYTAGNNLHALGRKLKARIAINLAEQSRATLPPHSPPTSNPGGASSVAPGVLFYLGGTLKRV